MRRTHSLGLALAAGLLAACPASTARAQAAYGYDSYYQNLPQSAEYWYSAGYSPVYNDATTTTFATPAVAPYRGLTPYMQPPYGTFARPDGLSTRISQGPVIAPTRQTAAPAPPRRTLLGRLRGRR